MNAKLQAHWLRLKTDLAADKRKTITLAVLVVVLIVAVGRLFLAKGPQPDIAVAVSPSAAPTPQPVTPVPADPAAGAQPAMRPIVEKPTPRKSLSPVNTADAPVVESTVDAGRHGPTKTTTVNDVPQPIARDLFSTSAWVTFPKTGDKATTRPVYLDGGEDFWNRVAAGLAARRTRASLELDGLEAEARELKLGATLVGPNPAAYISGRLVHIGDEIRGFSVVTIEDRSVHLAKNGYILSIKLP